MVAGECLRPGDIRGVNQGLVPAPPLWHHQKYDKRSAHSEKKFLIEQSLRSHRLILCVLKMTGNETIHARPHYSTTDLPLH